MRQYESVFPAVIELACEAGKEIMAIYDNMSDAAVITKSDNSPLTEADLAAHALICKGLRGLTPSVSIVSEEDDNKVERSRQGEFWLIDPLDGTKEFIARNGEFTVNIALIRDGAPVWGVVCAPALNQVYWGGPGMGAFRRNEQGTVNIAVNSAAGTTNTYRVVASKSHLNEDTSAFIGRLGQVELVQAGSSLKFCRIAEATADIYPRLAPTCEWDTAAAHAIVEAAGGHVVDTTGCRLQYGKANVLNPNFIASAKPLHELEQG